MKFHSYPFLLLSMYSHVCLYAFYACNDYCFCFCSIKNITFFLGRLCHNFNGKLTSSHGKPMCQIEPVLKVELTWFGKTPFSFMNPLQISPLSFVKQPQNPHSFAEKNQKNLGFAKSFFCFSNSSSLFCKIPSLPQKLTEPTFCFTVSLLWFCKLPSGNPPSLFPP